MSEADILDRRLRDLYDEIDPLPEHVLEAALGAFVWRTIDAELAELAADSSLTTSSVRGDQSARLLTFESDNLTIEVEIAQTGSTRRIVGQLVPPTPASIEVQTPDTTPVTVEADALGRFAVSDVPAGLMRLTVVRPGAEPHVTTRWASI